MRRRIERAMAAKMVADLDWYILGDSAPTVRNSVDSPCPPTTKLYNDPMAPTLHPNTPYAAADVRINVRSDSDPRRVRFCMVRLTPTEHRRIKDRAAARGVSLSAYLRRCALDEAWVAEALASPLPPAHKAQVAAHAVAVRAEVEGIVDPAGTMRAADLRQTHTYWRGP